MKSKKWEFINDTMSTEVQYASVCDRTICLTIGISVDWHMEIQFILFIYFCRTYLTVFPEIGKQTNNLTCTPLEMFSPWKNMF